VIVLAIGAAAIASQASTPSEPVVTPLGPDPTHRHVDDESVMGPREGVIAPPETIGVDVVPPPDPSTAGPTGPTTTPVRAPRTPRTTTVSSPPPPTTTVAVVHDPPPPPPPTSTVAVREPPPPPTATRPPPPTSTVAAPPPSTTARHPAGLAGDDAFDQGI
jgi:hypothetical protein